MADSLKAIHTFSDPGFDRQRFYEQELVLCLGPDGFAFCILDLNTNKFCHLEAFSLSGTERKVIVPGEEQKYDLPWLRRLFENELAWLTNPYSKVRLVCRSGKSTLVPGALFSEEERAVIYNFNMAGGPYESSSVYHDFISSADACAIYYLPPDLKQWLQKLFPEARIFHHATILIQSLVQKYSNLENKNLLFVNTSATGIEVLQILNKKPGYCNSFTYNTAEDYLYYLIFVVEQLQLNPETIELMMLGEVDRHSSLSEMVHKYIRNVSFMERNSDFRYSFVFDRMPGHYYYTLFNASLCE
jgi:hypothetical protein